MMMRDLTFTPAVELGRLYRRRIVSPLEVMQALLARIPVGLQIVGKRRGEGAVLQAAAAFEAARPWSEHVPHVVRKSA